MSGRSGRADRRGRASRHGDRRQGAREDAPGAGPRSRDGSSPRGSPALVQREAVSQNDDLPPRFRNGHETSDLARRPLNAGGVLRRGPERWYWYLSPRRPDEWTSSGGHRLPAGPAGPTRETGRYGTGTSARTGTSTRTGTGTIAAAHGRPGWSRPPPAPRPPPARPGPRGTRTGPSSGTRADDECLCVHAVTACQGLREAQHRDERAQEDRGEQLRGVRAIDTSRTSGHVSFGDPA